MPVSALLVMALAVERPRVVATYRVPGPNAERLAAEQVKRPKGVAADAYAAQLVKAEGLKSWGPMDPVSSAPSAALPYKARHAGDGREVVVYYTPAARAVCRVRRSRGGLSDAHQAAIRWCAAALGVTLPARPAPIVGSD